ncbi:MAG: DUF1194 domain-containing protein [Pseudomonadota bacterium]|nr:DUF1194 domain-containing protein [Pseudomonadota bacterium]
MNNGVLRAAGALLALAAMLLPWATGDVSHADDISVDLELVLAVDVSLSMDREEQRLQRAGYVAAFRHPEVIAAIRAGQYQRIAVTYFEWAGERIQRPVSKWQLIDSAASAQSFADDLEKAEISGAHRTSISAALNYASGLFEGNGFQGLRRVVDVSGDGPNNMGLPVDQIRDRVVERGIVINGLPIVLKPGSALGFYDIRNLQYYYEDCVIGGIGSFLVTVHDEAEFADAIRRKLIQELAMPMPRIWRAQFTPQRAKSDCLIGEKLWNEMRE